MPIISRSQLQLYLREPSWVAIPVHVLAAIYAHLSPSAFTMPRCVFLALSKPSPIDELWRMVYEIILREIHTTKLAVLQASLLYLQRFPKGTQSAINDSPFVWSFFGSLVNLANTLGLQYECQLWGIPAWEKRLRRRFWWIVYVEDKWRSLLTGRPPMIRDQEWDVGVLDDGYFVVDQTRYDTTDE